MRDRTKILLGFVALMGWGLLMVRLVTERVPTPVENPRTIDGGDIHRTHDTVAPILELRDLVHVGIRAEVIRSLESHFYVLNAALVTLVRARAEFDTASTDAVRAELLQRASTFHTTAHRHEEQIERILTADEKRRFHAYVRERELRAGLPPDTVWHVH